MARNGAGVAGLGARHTRLEGHHGGRWGRRSEGDGVVQSLTPTAPGGEVGAAAADGRRVGRRDVWAGTSGNCGRGRVHMWVIFT
jgi:hypothetical protein